MKLAKLESFLFKLSGWFLGVIIFEYHISSQN